MKKIVFTLIAVAFAANAFAAAPARDPKGFNRTKDVTVTANKNAAGDAWGAGSSHSKGDKQYYTTSAYGGLTFIVVNPGDAIGTITTPSTSTDSTTPSGTPM